MCFVQKRLEKVGVGDPIVLASHFLKEAGVNHYFVDASFLTLF